MDFLEIAKLRQSCRSYDETRMVEEEKLLSVLEAARFAPSACNGQPYHLTVCRGEAAHEVAKATMGVGLNKFAPQAPVLIVISEMPYVKSAGVGAKVKPSPCNPFSGPDRSETLPSQAGDVRISILSLGRGTES